MSKVNASLREEIIARAGNCCEYCRISQEDSFLPFHVDHIIAEKHHGETTVENLCLSCPHCNTHKGSDISSIDLETTQLTPLFNPRIQIWDAHFALKSALISPVTAVGRVTVHILSVNSEKQVLERAGLIRLKRYPCEGGE
ncbi:MAG: HNH endonuclease [Aggregatilineales bacterium]